MEALFIIDWDGENKNLHNRCSDVGLDFTWLSSFINKGCDEKAQAWATHGAELDASRKNVLTSFIDVNTKEALRTSIVSLVFLGTW